MTDRIEELRREAWEHLKAAEKCLTLAHALMGELVEVEHVRVAPSRRSPGPRSEHRERVVQGIYALTRGGRSFTTSELRQWLHVKGHEVPSEYKLTQILNEWKKHGTIRSHGNTKARYWTRVPHPAEPVNRRSQTPPEVAVVHRNPSQRARTSRTRVSGKAVREAARKSGLRLVRHKHRVEFVDDAGTVVATSSEDARGLKRTNKQLRQAGY